MYRRNLAALAAAVFFGATPMLAQQQQPQKPKDKPVTVEQVGKNVEAESKRVANRTGKAARKAGKQTEKQAKRTAHSGKKAVSRTERREARGEVEKTP